MADKEKYTVDLWRTGMHREEIGIKRTEELISKARQFTKDSDIFGEVQKDKERVGFLAYREGLWKEKPPKNRLVIRYFSESFGWKGSLDQLLGISVAHTFSAENPMPAFMINVDKTDSLIRMEKVARTRSVGKRVYAMLIPSEKGGSEFYTVDEARVSLGTDWNVKNTKGDKIASIDGKIVDIGGEWTISFTKAPSSELATSLILFAAANKFLDDVEKNCAKVAEGVKKGKMMLDLDAQELELYQNPRRFRT